MIISRKTIIKKSPLQLVLIIAAIVAVTMSMSILPSNNTAIAQTALFREGVKVYLDKDIYNGKYGILIKNLDTGAEVVDSFYTDRGSNRRVYIDESIVAHHGDSLEACVMDMSSEDMACDTSTAYKDRSTTDFFIDMVSAH